MAADDRPTDLVRSDPATLARAHASRERVIARLSEAFAHDTLDVEEFERRVTVAQVSESPDEIEGLLLDLPTSGGALTGRGTSGGALGDAPPAVAAPVRSTAMAPATAAAIVPAGEAQEARTLFAIMGGIDRRGAWTVPRRLRVISVMGGAHLDLREALFPPGPIDIEVIAFMGGTEIVVPPGLAVQTHGTAIMGGFQETNRAPAHPDPNAPLLRVHGFAVMGGVEISMRLPGESEREARRRQRHELRDERRAARALDRADRG